MRWVLCAFIVAGCATAGKGNQQPIDASGGDDDAPIEIDAPPPIDAPIMVTLSETVDSNVAAGNSIGCINGNNTMADTNWYRVFQLSDFSIVGKFHVQSLTMAVQNSAGTPTLTFNIGTYAGAIGGTTVDMAMYSQLATTTMQIPVSATAENVNVPLLADIPANGKFLVQIIVPQQSGNNHYVFIGATTAGETHPGYYSSQAAGCATAIETTVAAGSTGQIIINVTGTH